MLSHSNRENRPDEVIRGSNGRSGAEVSPVVMTVRDVAFEAKIVDDLLGLEWKTKRQTVGCRVGPRVAEVSGDELRRRARSALPVADGSFAEAKITDGSG